jgi:large subunit ribosomal protein L3
MKNRTGLIATKIGNSSYFSDNGKVIPVTLLRVDECIVSNIKTLEKDGYTSLQVASIDCKSDLKKINKPQQKLFANIKTNPKKIIKEFRVDPENTLEVGTKLDVSHFQKDQYVDVTSKSIGKGFAGAMKRHNFGGLRASHGVSVSHRAHGSTGQNQDPGKVFKGKKMAGHMGDKIRTIQNLEVIKSDNENNLLYLKGSIPGSKNTEVIVKKSVKNIQRLTIKKN